MQSKSRQPVKRFLCFSSDGLTCNPQTVGYENPFTLRFTCLASYSESDKKMGISFISVRLIQRYVSAKMGSRRKPLTSIKTENWRLPMTLHSLFTIWILSSSKLVTSALKSTENWTCVMLHQRYQVPKNQSSYKDFWMIVFHKYWYILRRAKLSYKYWNSSSLWSYFLSPFRGAQKLWSCRKVHFSLWELS